MGMAPVQVTPPAVPKDSALLKCEHCGKASRIWLCNCKYCTNPEDNWYETRIAELEKIIDNQDKTIRAQADLLNGAYSAKLTEWMNRHDTVTSGGPTAPPAPVKKE
jgi:hypothetical protein